MAGLGAEPAPRLTAEAAYGLALFDGAATATPYLGLGLADAARDHRIGYRLPGAGHGLTLQATHRW